MGNRDFDDNDFELFEEKYMNRRDSRGSIKPKNHIIQILNRDRRNSTGSSKMEKPLTQPAVEKTQEFYSKEVTSKAKIERERSSSTEADIDEELVNLIKDMSIKPNTHAQNDGSEIAKNVLYYGWFLSQTTSESLKKLGDAYLKECLQVQQFQRWLETTSSEKGSRDTMSYYQESDTPLLHVTAMFCGRTLCLPYAEFAQQFLGIEFSLSIVGLFFTEKTYGLRIKLTEEQEKLFDGERGKLVSRRNSYPCCPTEPEVTSQEKKVSDNTGQACMSKKLKAGSTSVPGGKEKKISKRYPGLTFLPQPENFQPTDTRAHITIRCGKNIRAKQAGEDLLDIVDMELRSSTPIHDYKIPSGILRQFGRHGDYVFVIYPKNQTIARGVFMPFI